MGSLETGKLRLVVTCRLWANHHPGHLHAHQVTCKADFTPFFVSLERKISNHSRGSLAAAAAAWGPAAAAAKVRRGADG